MHIKYTPTTFINMRCVHNSNIIYIKNAVISNRAKRTRNKIKKKTADEYYRFSCLCEKYYNYFKRNTTTQFWKFNMVIFLFSFRAFPLICFTHRLVPDEGVKSLNQIEMMAGVFLCHKKKIGQHLFNITISW